MNTSSLPGSRSRSPDDDLSNGPAVRPRDSPGLPWSSPTSPGRRSRSRFRRARPASPGDDRPVPGVPKVPHPAAALAARSTRAASPAAWGKAARSPHRRDQLRRWPRRSEASTVASLPSGLNPMRDDRPGGFFLPGDDGHHSPRWRRPWSSAGAAEVLLDGVPVDRLGPPGSALMARKPRALLVAGSRNGLNEARSGQNALAVATTNLASDSRSSRCARWLEVVDAPAVEDCLARGSRPDFRHGRPGRLIIQRLDRHRRRPARQAGAAGRAELAEWLPSDRTMAAFAVAIAPAPANWDAAFRLADLVEKVDPTRENLVPIRLRPRTAGEDPGHPCGRRPPATPRRGDVG